jgi:hypothetical protein
MQPDDPILDLLDFDDAEVFAVVDGAMVDDLKHRVAAYNLPAQALYFDHHSDGANENGPHLIHCVDASVIVTLRGAFPADGVVWWVWADPDASHAKAAIFRHLRRLGHVEIPAGYPNTNPHPRWEQVLFRHADARVMARVLPVLDPAQRARLFGRAGAIVLAHGDQLRRALVPADLPMAPPGFLRLTRAQMDVVNTQAQTAHDDTIMRYLRRNAAYETEGMTEPELKSLSRRASLRAKELGFMEDKSILLLAFLAAITGGAALTAPEIDAAIKQSDLSPDAALMAILDAMKAAEQDGA